MPTDTKKVKASEYVTQGNEHQQQGNINRAIESYQKAIALQPEQPVWVYTGLGEALERNGQIEEAIAVYQKAIEIMPDNCRVQAKLATLMMREGNIEGAVTAYQKAITQANAQKPKQPEWFYGWVYTGLGEALEINGQIEEALAAYQKVIEINPDKPENSIAHAKLARAMMAQKNCQGAIASYQKAIVLQPEQPVWVYASLGDALNQNGQIEEAISAYQTAIEIMPDNSIVYDKLVRAKAMRAQKNTRDFPERKGDSKSEDQFKALRIKNFKGKSLLHIGCNEGFFCNKARKLGASRVVGIDKSKQAIEEAKKRFPDLDFRCQSWDILPEEKFDFILLLSDIHYEKDQKSLFDRIRLALNPGGKLLLECGVITVDDARWVRVDRGNDSVLFPTQGMLQRYLLKDFAVRYCGRSARETGDPIKRYIYHATPYQPILVIVAGESGSGKTVLTKKLSKSAEIFSLDNHIDMLIQYRKTDLANFLRTDFAVGIINQRDLVDEFVNSILESIIISPITFVEGAALSLPPIRKAFELKAIEKGFVLWSMDRIKEVK